MTTSPRLVYTPSPGRPYRRFDAGAEVIYADFSAVPALNGYAWVCEPGSRGAVAVDVTDLSVEVA